MSAPAFTVVSASTGRVLAEGASREVAAGYLEGYSAEAPGLVAKLDELEVGQAVRTHPLDTRGLRVTRVRDEMVVY